MKKWLVVAALAAVAVLTVNTQTSVTGRWRAVIMLPDGSTREITLEMKADGAAIAATVPDAPLTVREGRIEGDRITLRNRARTVPAASSRSPARSRATRSSSAPRA